MRSTNLFRRFINENNGSVIVEWVIIVGLVTGLCLIVFYAFSG